MDENIDILNLKASDPTEDWLLYEKFKNGDQSAFHELFNRHKTRAINLSYRFVRNQEVAEDIAQDVLIKVYEKKVSPGLNAKFSTWLYRVTVNASLDYLRSKGSHLFSLNEKLAGEDDEETHLDKTADLKALSPSENLEKHELQDLVRREVDNLPEKLKSCALLYQFEEMSYREIAMILGISEKAVERRLYHAKEALKEKFAKYFPQLT